MHKMKGMGGYEFSFVHTEFEGHLRQLTEMSGRQMYVYTILEPTGKLWAGDTDL